MATALSQATVGTVSNTVEEIKSPVLVKAYYIKFFV